MKSILKNLIVGIGSLVLFTHTASGQWVKINVPFGGGCRNFDISLPSGVSAFAVTGNNMFVGIDSGVFLSTNNGASWTAANFGLPATASNYSCVVNRFTVSGNNIFAGTDEYGVYISANNGTSWKAVNNGLTQYLMQGSWSTINLLAICDSAIFAETYLGGICLSTDNGVNWFPINEGFPTNSGSNYSPILYEVMSFASSST